MSRKLTIEDFKKIAVLKGGKCLSDEYENINQKLKWQCSKGHVWEAKANYIRNCDNWCPHCAGKAKITIDKLKNIAEERNGKCLSHSSSGNKSKLKWQCENGHTWLATPNNVMRGSWCPECTGYYNEERCRFILEQILGVKFNKTRKPLDNKFELDGYNDKLNLAFEYHGIQHYEFVKHFHKTSEDLEKRKKSDFKKQSLCNLKGIKLIVIPYYKSNSEEELIQFITECLVDYGIHYNSSNTNNINFSSFYKNHSKIKEMHEVACENGGKCLSNTYSSSKTKYLWQCNKGHTWEANYTEIKNHNRWCPFCAGTMKLTLKDMQQTAEEKGGKCLSESYIDVDTKYLWGCKNNHTWYASYSSIRRGSWCPHCSGTAKKTIQDMQELAELHNGKCLSETYINSHTKLLWRCQLGHTWESKPNDIQQGHWCPICSRINRKKKPI